MASAIHIVNRIRSGLPLTNLQGTLLALAIVAVIMLLAWLLKAMHYGVDLTDEGFYFNSISNPWIYPYSATQFGFMYYPLYELVGENIVRLRQASLLITFGLAWGVSWCLIRRAGEDNAAFTAGGKLPALALSAALAVPATTTLILTDLWMPTPSYNTLNFQGFMIATLGLLLARSQASRSSLVGWMLIAVGGWVSFMAKPTSAAFLGVIVLVYLLLLRQSNLRLLALSALTACCLLLLSAWAIDGSVTGFVDRFKTGVMAINIMRARHTHSWFRWDEIVMSPMLKLNILLVTLVVAGLVYGILAGSRYVTAAAILFSAVALAATLAVALGFYQPRFAMHRYHGLQLWGLVLGVFLAMLILSIRHQKKVILGKGVALGILMLLLPYAYAFGSGNNYWQTAVGAALFWTLGAAVLLLHSRHASVSGTTMMVPVAGLVMLLTVTSLATSMHRPYRQLKPLMKNSQPIEFSQGETRLLVNDRFAEYLNSLRLQVAASGFVPGTPVIDLTGHRPGVTFFLGGQAVGQPWLLGGYPGSQKLTEFALDRVTCETLVDSWVMVEEKGPRAISTELLKRYGIDFNNDLEFAAKASGKHGYRWKGDPESNLKTSFVTKLYKPNAAKRAELKNKCESTRQSALAVNSHSAYF